MRNTKLDEFLHKNRLKSTDLVEFWGVTKGVVSQILNGTTKLPAKRLDTLLNNPHGWDVSMLVEKEAIEDDDIIEENPEAKSTTDRLFALIDDQREEIKMLLDLLRMKDEKIDELRRELDARKEKTAQNVDSSSSVNVG